MRRYLFVICSLLMIGAPIGMTAPVAHGSDTLADVLREKGIITRKDWERIQAERNKEADSEQEQRTHKFPVKLGWGKKGFSLETLDGKWKTTLQWRFQGRWTYPERSDPRDAAAFSDNAESTFELRRVRMKIGGHGYRPWIKYYFEVDLQPTRDFDDDSAKASSRLLDWRVMIERFPWLRLRIGQWKVNLNRERVDSSGKQQFVERSIVNRVFTIDRQMGAMVYGRVFPGTIADAWYYAGVFTGSGRGVKNDDANMLYMGRIQWNFLGRDLPFSQSDVEYHRQPAGSIAGAVYTTIGRCTRWSSSGCGNLSGFIAPDAAADGQFRVEGIVEEVAFKWRGFSFQHEFHWKQIKDSSVAEGAPGHRTNLFGSYAQVGYFPHYVFPMIPKPLETAFRYAFVDPNISVTGDFRQEFTGALNWFFAGHRNKLTLDVSHLTLDQIIGNDLTEQRIRLQWDVSF